MENSRRDFIRKSAFAGGLGLGIPSLLGAEALAKPTENKIIPSLNEAPKAEPTKQQKAWMDLGFGMFIHFGINTYYDTEWSDGTLDPSKVNPTKLNPDQWCETAKAAGMKYLILVTKHHDGFCNFITKHTKYGIANTPYKKDIVEATANACAKHGIKFGIYYSLWDRNHPLHDKDEMAYADFMMLQLEELFSKYGPITELWFDGFWKKQKGGWKPEGMPDSKIFNSAEAFMAAWRSEGAYRWKMDQIYQQVKRWQPDCLVMNNSTTAFPGVPLFPVDIRCGEKAQDMGEDRKVWPWLSDQVYLPLQIETTMSQKGKKGSFESGSWFWHEWDDSVASKDKILGWLANAKKLEANLLLNCGPTPEGLLRKIDEKMLKSLRA